MCEGRLFDTSAKVFGNSQSSGAGYSLQECWFVQPKVVAITNTCLGVTPEVINTIQPIKIEALTGIEQTPLSIAFVTTFSAVRSSKLTFCTPMVWSVYIRHRSAARDLVR
jgi:hypothetical protein